MQKLRDLIDTLQLLNDWRQDLERAYETAADNDERCADWLGALEPEAPVQKEALLLDLAAYRALKASA